MGSTRRTSSCTDNTALQQWLPQATNAQPRKMEISQSLPHIEPVWQTPHKCIPEQQNAQQDILDTEIDLESVFSTFLGDAETMQDFLASTEVFDQCPSHDPSQGFECSDSQMESPHCSPAPPLNAYSSPPQPSTNQGDGSGSEFSIEEDSSEKLPLPTDPVMKRKLRNRRSAAASRIRKKESEKEVQRRMGWLVWQHDLMTRRLSALEQENSQLRKSNMELLTAGGAQPVQPGIPEPLDPEGATIRGTVVEECDGERRLWSMDKQLPLAKDGGSCQPIGPTDFQSAVLITFLLFMISQQWFHTRIGPKLKSSPSSSPSAFELISPTNEVVDDSWEETNLQLCSSALQNQPWISEIT